MPFYLLLQCAPSSGLNSIAMIPQLQRNPPPSLSTDLRKLPEPYIL